MLKVIELRGQLDEARAAAEAHLRSKPDFGARRAAVLAKSNELDERIDALSENATEEETKAIEADVAALEAEAAGVDTEEAAFDDAAFNAEQQRLDTAVTTLERQIAEIERNQNGMKTNHQEERFMPNYKIRSLSDPERRAAFFEREEVVKFVEDVRAIGLQNRSVTGAASLIPTSVLDVLRQEAAGYSKLLKYVRYAKVPGNARMPIRGTIPNAVWFEAYKALNRLTLGFNHIEAESYGVGGYIEISNFYLKSGSVADLGSEIMEALAIAIGVGVDKAILYGTNTKMPLGIVPRIAQTSDPSDSSIDVPWVDLHSTNEVTISNDYTGANFFRQLALARKAIKSKGYPVPHGLVWCMNESTYAAVQAEAVGANVAALGTPSVDKIPMPQIGGTIELLDFIPDNNIVAGYFDLYCLIERDGGEVAQSEHQLFIENMTVFKGVGYYDGMPAIANGFVVIGIGGTSVTESLSFDPDYANTDMHDLGVTAAAGGSVGKTVLTVTGTTTGNTLKYRIGTYNPGVGTALSNDWTSLTSGSTAITAATGTMITVAELDANSKVVGVGYATSNPKLS